MFNNILVILKIDLINYRISISLRNYKLLYYTKLINLSLCRSYLQKVLLGYFNLK